MGLVVDSGELMEMKRPPRSPGGDLHGGLAMTRSRMDVPRGRDVFGFRPLPSRGGRFFGFLGRVVVAENLTGDLHHLVVLSRNII